jgi:uncharacterized protein YdhG (YjbR/CyaY superfamily)
MKFEVQTIQDYLSTIPEDRKLAFQKLRETIINNLPKGFEEQISYGTIGYVVPHTIYPDGYHCNTKLPLPFINIASQKNFIALYHLGIYANVNLLDWFTQEYSKHCKHKLDMGKSCIRFKKIDQIPFELIGALISKISVAQWINLYNSTLKK